MFPDKRQSLLLNDISGIILLMARRIGIIYALVIIPQMAGEVIVRQVLAVVAKETVEALPERIAGRAYKTQPPLTKIGCCIACFLHQPGNGKSRIGQWP